MSVAETSTAAAGAGLYNDKRRQNLSAFERDSKKRSICQAVQQSSLLLLPCMCQHLTATVSTSNSSEGWGLVILNPGFLETTTAADADLARQWLKQHTHVCMYHDSGLRL
jgi:hypothetical protein